MYTLFLFIPLTHCPSVVPSPLWLVPFLPPLTPNFCFLITWIPLPYFPLLEDLFLPSSDPLSSFTSYTYTYINIYTHKILSLGSAYKRKHAVFQSLAYFSVMFLVPSISCKSSLCFSLSSVQFRFLAVVTSAAVNVDVQVTLWCADLESFVCVSEW